MRGKHGQPRRQQQPRSQGSLIPVSTERDWLEREPGNEVATTGGCVAEKSARARRNRNSENSFGYFVDLFSVVPSLNTRPRIKIASWLPPTS